MMFDLDQIIEFLKVEPGHGFVQSGLLFMIWLQSKGLRKEMLNLREALNNTRLVLEERFIKIEHRITVLEKGD